MNNVLVFFLCFLVLACAALTTLSCCRTYRMVSERRWRKKMMQYALENRGKIGQAQQWRCWECQTVMLSNYHIMLDQKGVVAVCHRCSSSSEKYQHIYGEGEQSKDCNV